MQQQDRGDADHHDGTADAAPGGYGDRRRPGELAFALTMVAGSAVLVWNAYGISGFSSMSSAGAVPLALTAVMALSALVIALQTLRRRRVATETLVRDILPPMVIVLGLGLLAFGLLLEPLGFVPTAALFLVGAIRILARCRWRVALSVGLGSLLVIWLVFRLVFTVLLPPGLLPEAELIGALRALMGGA
ncbi:tripartite tricarboxylate transporter TctB family protein [Pseudooceanicola sp. CBS1P-1]|uniref:Tripartite tricarboxylate transporter TctB family protein n=1 Tax=Pseudooceanicola albus TaxID=2692189 RepID=A0A6L7G8C7_9RHOB|nr:MULTISPECIES: tripartite tricarboxylate transporter TctB family protein [Pseudooceanicola]MBT9385658.1 tripartite tricarboxylate transporter TctB family protein [Pseudooceanicola endophyticus]MXN18933.1 tripartite tricarboxylate transporter TctB family protein [Pseudooceanicola albus]